MAVVIPCYNHGRFVREALASAQAQTYPHVDCVIVNDGSTDDRTRGVLRELEREGVHVVHQDNAGLAAARNTGVRATEAEYFVPLDADDRLHPEFVMKLLPVLRDDESLGYAYSRVVLFGADSGEWLCPEYDAKRLLIENLSVATALVRRRAFDDAGGYSPDMTHGFEDWDFWVALLAVGYAGRLLPEPLFYYRKHAGGSMLIETQKRRAEMIRRMIEHHRGLFATTLESSFTGKDGLFFQAHMDAWRARQAAVRAGAAGAGGAATTVEDRLYQALLARAELDSIESSRFWRTIERIKRLPPIGLINRLRFGPGWDRQNVEEPAEQRLARIKASRTYRAIRAVKRLPPYRWYARRKYGPDFDRVPG